MERYLYKDEEYIWTLQSYNIYIIHQVSLHSGCPTKNNVIVFKETALAPIARMISFRNDVNKTSCHMPMIVCARVRVCRVIGIYCKLRWNFPCRIQPLMADGLIIISVHLWYRRSDVKTSDSLPIKRKPPFCFRNQPILCRQITTELLKANRSPPPFAHDT